MADKFQLKALIIGQDKLTPTLKGVQKNVATLQASLRKTGLGNLGFKDLLVGGALAAPIIAATKAAIGFESQMADLRTSVQFETPQQFAQMSQDLLKLTTRVPVARDELMKVAQVGGQARIARDELVRFTESAARMGLTFGTGAEQAASQMAKWRSSMGLTQDAANTLADQITWLGNNTRATSAQLAAIVTDVGPLARAANLSTSQVLALGSAFIQMGADEGAASSAISSMTQALSVGTLATKKQQVIFKALRLDAAQVARGMQSDAQGTMLRIMTAISRVAPEKQAVVLKRLFGDSAATILPLVKNVDLLRERFGVMSDEQLTAGALMADYTTKTNTTGSAMQQFRARLDTLAITVGNILLPPLNQFLVLLEPIMEGVLNIAQTSPWLVKGLLGMAGGFTAVRIGVFAAIKGLGLMRAALTLMNTNPVMLALTALALAAGFIIANWDTVGPFFKRVWNAVYGAVKPVWDWLANVVMNYSPLGFLIRNWQPILNFMSALWDATKAVTSIFWEWMKGAFLNFTPLGLIIKNWEPIVTWFSQLWDRVKPYIEPLVNGARWLGGRVGNLVGGAQAAVNERGGAGGIINQAAGQVRDWSASLPQQAAGQQRMQGDMTVRFENAPPNLRVDRPKESPGLTINPQVGYRSLAGGQA